MSDGRKDLTPENWLERDPVMAYFVRIATDDSVTGPVPGGDRVAEIMEVRLHAGVPEDVRGIFEAA
jgi:hypothetical protein